MIVSSENDKPLVGKVALVTGSARGAGRAMVLEFARQGASVVVADRTDKPFLLPGTIHTVAAEAAALGVLAVPFKVDVRIEDEIIALRDAVLSAFGTIDYVVNNAGIQFASRTWELPTERWDDVLSVNARGTFLMCKNFISSMIEKGRGSILNISSVVGRAGSLDVEISEDGLPSVVTAQAAYAASKGAIDQLTVILAREVRPFNVAVNSLAPSGAVDTEGQRHLIADQRIRTQWEPADHYARVAVWVCQQPPAKLTGQLLYSRQTSSQFGICKRWCCATLGDRPIIGGPWRVVPNPAVREE